MPRPRAGLPGSPARAPGTGAAGRPLRPAPARRAFSAERFAVSGAGGSESAHSGPSEVSAGEEWLGGEDTLVLARRVAPGLQVAWNVHMGEPHEAAHHAS